jgi:hypothetical protein
MEGVIVEIAYPILSVILSVKKHKVVIINSMIFAITLITVLSSLRLVIA